MAPGTGLLFGNRTRDPNDRARNKLESPSEVHPIYRGEKQLARCRIAIPRLPKAEFDETPPWSAAHLHSEPVVTTNRLRHTRLRLPPQETGLADFHCSGR